MTAIRAQGDFCNLPCSHPYCREICTNGELVDVIVLPSRSRSTLYMNYCYHRHYNNGGPLQGRSWDIEELTGYELVGGNYSHDDDYPKGLHSWRLASWKHPLGKPSWRLLSWYLSEDHENKCLGYRSNRDPALVYSVLSSGQSSYRFKRHVLMAIRPYVNRNNEQRRCQWCRKLYRLGSRMTHDNDNVAEHAACGWAMKWEKRLDRDVRSVLSEGARLLDGLLNWQDRQCEIDILNIWLRENRTSRRSVDLEDKQRRMVDAERLCDIEKFLNDVLAKQFEEREEEERQWKRARHILRAARRAIQKNDIPAMRAVLKGIRSELTEVRPR